MAPTGYGLGEKTSLAYSARLLAGFASRGSTGRPRSARASCREAGATCASASPSVYDIKALHEATFYGLPMYRLGSTGQVMGSFLPEEGTPSGPPPANATTSVTYQPAASALEQVTTPDGSYFTVAGAPPQVTPNQPIQPLTSIDLLVAERQAHRPGRRPRADDVLRHRGLDPVYATESVAAVPTSAPEPAVRSPRSHPGPRRSSPPWTRASSHASLAFIPGQFATDGSGGGTGNQRIFTKATFTVNWSASSDFERPDISTVSATLTGTPRRFRVCSPATDVNRGVLLFLPSGGPTRRTGCTSSWSSPRSAAGWARPRWPPASPRSASSTPALRRRRQLWRQHEQGSQLHGLSLHAAVLAGRRSRAGVQRPVPRSDHGDDHGARRAAFTASVDDLPPISCTGTCFVTVTGDGAHVVRAVSGGITTEAAIPIDTPSAGGRVAARRPGLATARARSSPTSFSCSSALTVTACGGPSRSTPPHPDHTVSFTATDQFGLSTTVQRTYIVDGTPPTLSFGSGPPVITNAGHRHVQVLGRRPRRARLLGGLHLQARRRSGRAVHVALRGDVAIAP